MNIKKFLVGFSASAILMVSTAIPAFADSVAVDFEGPPYTTGIINGQDGWSSLGAAGSGCAVYDHAVASSLSTTGFGLQSLRISNAVTSGCFGDMTFAKPLANSVGEVDATAGTFSEGIRQPHFEMQFDIASAVPGSQQPGLFMSVSPDRGDGSRMSYVGFEDVVGGIDIIFYDVQGTGDPANFVLTDLGTFSRTPHTIKLVMDVVDGPSNDVVKVYIDGVLEHTGTSWENYYRYDNEASAEQSPRIVKSAIFRTGGGAAPGTAGNGYLIDNLSLLSGPIPNGPPVNVAQCKDNGWKTFNNPEFKNQGDCVSYFAKDSSVGKVTGNIQMANPNQQINFNAFDYGFNSSQDKGSVEYWNYDYPGPLHYTANVLCASVDKVNKNARFMFRIPAGWPGLTGLYVVSAMYDGGTPGTNGDTYGHGATGSFVIAKIWCETGIGFVPNSYPIVGGNLVVHN